MNQPNEASKKEVSTSKLVSSSQPMQDANIGLSSKTMEPLLKC